MNAPVAIPDTLSDGLMEAVRDAVRLPVGTRIVAAMSGGAIGRSVTEAPILSVAPIATPGFTPPPAITIENACGQ